MEIKITALDGYSPQIGHLISMMNYVRKTTLDAVHGLGVEQLDYLPHKKGNSIGALLWHMAAVEFGFQVELFDGRKPTKQEADEWGAAFDLGEQGRQVIKGHSLEFYLEKLAHVRKRTLAEFKKKDDDWLYQNVGWGDIPSNPYFIWFHVFEDEINHRGQIRVIRNMQAV
ncbi:DinB family protein [Lentibacillus sp. N15]|uniref:DinB family protein n=1 Tax=Lentibacillus songyuanensis TaxID=3136161 RepID=UPI0031B9E0B7